MSRVLVGTLALYALGTAVFELVARACWTAPWYERLVTEQTERQRLDYARNEWRLRDRSYGPREERTLRVMVLGASCVMGLGVADDEALFPKILERRLGELDWNGVYDRVEVLNAGVNASRAHHWSMLYKRVGGDFDPDVVLVVFAPRDGTRLGLHRGFFDDVRAADIPAEQRSSFLYRHSYAWRTVQDRLDRRRIAEEYCTKFRAAYLGTEEETAEWRKAQEVLARMRDLAGERGDTIGFTVFPFLVELNRDHPFRAEVGLIASTVSDLGYPTHDLLADFEGEYAPDLWVSALDQHPNERAHALAAESLVPFVVELAGRAGR